MLWMNVGIREKREKRKDKGCGNGKRRGKR